MFDFWAVLSEWRLLVHGVAWTLALTAVATVVGGVLGVAGAWARASGPAPLRWVVGAYVELIRNTPFIVQLFFIFFGLPAAGLRLSPETASFIAMVVNLGAYATEIVRAGLQATPRWQVFSRVVLPPALKKVWPALVSQIVIVMFGSAVCGQISTPELSYAANLIKSRNFRDFEAIFVATGLYLVLAIALRQLLNWAGPRFFFGR
jgi:polar amino acid transport system permease protein